MTNKNNLKASLKVQLMADDVLVAESDDPDLWKKILSAIHTGEAEAISPVVRVQPEGKNNDSQPGVSNISSLDSAILNFANDIGVSVEDVMGACNPSFDPPYIFLDDYSWEELKKNTPPRGPKAVPQIALAASLLNLWFKHSKVSVRPTINQCQEVLATIHLPVDKNVNRSIKNTRWLQKREKELVINPSMRSKAVNLARAYCLRQEVDT
jgi:hypothetical protein